MTRSPAAPNHDGWDLPLAALVVATVCIAFGLLFAAFGIAGFKYVHMDLLWAYRSVEIGFVLGASGLLPTWWSWFRVAWESRRVRAGPVAGSSARRHYRAKPTADGLGDPKGRDDGHGNRAVRETTRSECGAAFLVRIVLKCRTQVRRHPFTGQVFGTVCVLSGLAGVVLGITGHRYQATDNLRWADDLVELAWIVALAGLIPIWWGWLELAGEERRGVVHAILGRARGKGRRR